MTIPIHPYFGAIRFELLNSAGSRLAPESGDPKYLEVHYVPTGNLEEDDGQIIGPNNEVLGRSEAARYKPHKEPLEILESLVSDLCRKPADEIPIGFFERLVDVLIDILKLREILSLETQIENIQSGGNLYELNVVPPNDPDPELDMLVTEIMDHFAFIDLEEPTPIDPEALKESILRDLNVALEDARTDRCFEQKLLPLSIERFEIGWKARFLQSLPSHFKY